MAKKLNQATFKYGGEEINLSKSETEAAVRLTPGVTPSKRASRSLAGADLESFRVVKSASKIDSKLDKIRAMPEVSVGSHVYHLDGQDDVPFVPTGKLYIEFHPDSDPEKRQDLLDKLNLNIIEVVGEGMFRVATTADSPNPIKCTVALQKNKLVAIAEPEFVTVPSQRDFAPPLGQFIGTQWHLENTGAAIPIFEIPNAVMGASHFKKGADARVRAAWNFLGGLGSKTLKIAVIDTGFDNSHPALRGDGRKIRNPFNAYNRTADTSPLYQTADGGWGVFSHGTSCAAVAAGALDLKGILGACPNAQIIPIKLDILSDEAIKNAFEHAFLNGADIISCSLGFPKPVPLSTYVANYLTKIAREGRSGRGLPMFFAAGNANPNSNWEPREVSDFARHPEVFCVTASNSLDQRSDYSFFGKNAFLCAPTNGEPGAGITTATVDLAPDGVSIAQTYTSGFGGTSSAAPLAAGITALMLSANPNLTLAQIRDVLKKTCVKIGAAAQYDANGRSTETGFGRIDALAAVKMADALASGGSSSGGNSTPSPTPTPAPTPAKKLQGKVLSQTLNVRSGAATSFSKVKELKLGDVVSLLAKVDGWWKIGEKQFVSALYIAQIPATRTGKVNNTYLNVRSGAGVSFSKVGELKLGDVVTIFETTAEGWYRIGDNRWVLGKYINLL